MWGSRDWRNPLLQCPGLVSSPWSSLLTVASFHFIYLNSLKMWTLLGGYGQSTRQPSALSDGLEMKFVLEVVVDGDLGIHCLLPLPPSLFPLFHLSTSTLCFLLSWPYSLLHPGALGPLIEASDNPSHYSVGQKTSNQGSRGPAHQIPAQPRLPCKDVQGVHCTTALHAGITVHTHHRCGQFVYLL